MNDVGLTPVSEEGDSVLLVRGHILDVLFEAPTDPESGAKYLFDVVGRANFVVELIDSASNERLLQATHDRATDSLSSDPVSQGVEVEQIAALWGELLVESIGYLRAAGGAANGR